MDNMIKLPAEVGQQVKTRLAMLAHVVKVLEQEMQSYIESAAGQKLNPDEWNYDMDHNILERKETPAPQVKRNRNPHSFMVTPQDESNLTAQVAGVQATLEEQGKHLDRVEGKLDSVSEGIITRFDTVYPKMANIDTRLSAVEEDVKETRAFIWKIIGGAVIAFVSFIFALIQAGKLF